MRPSAPASAPSQPGTPQEEYCTMPPVASGEALVRLASGTVLNERNAARSLGLPMGCLITPVPCETLQLPVSSLPPSACSSCGANLNVHCKTDPRTGSWQCCFCKQSIKDARPLHDPQACPELSHEAVDYQVNESEVVQRSSNVPHDDIVLILDITAAPDTLEALKILLQQVVAGLPPACRVALLAFAAGVHVFDLSSAAPVTATALPGHSLMSAQLLEHLRADARLECLQPLHTCMPALHAAIHSLRSSATEHDGLRERPRCLGAALAAGMHLLNGWESEQGAGRAGSASSTPRQQAMSRAAAPSFGHILLITCGPCTRGPGFVPMAVLDGTPHPKDSHLTQQAAGYFRSLSLWASHAGTAVDVFAVGNLAVNAPMLSRLCDATGGALILHEEMGMLLGSSLQAALQRREGLHGIMDMCLSPGLAITRITGPSSAVDRGPHGLLMRIQGGGWRGSLSPNARELRSVSKGQSFAVALDVVRPLQGPCAFIQVVVGWTGRDGRQVQRVVTRRLRTTAALSTHLQSLDVRMTALLLAKGVVGRAIELQAAADAPVRTSLRQALAKHLLHVAEQVGEKVPVVKTWYGRQKHLWKLPAELRYLAEALYQLQRGQLLGKAACHADERAFLHAIFAAAPCETAQAMLAPTLYLHDPSTNGFHPVLAADTALTPDACGVLDNGAHIFIWLGHTAQAADSSTALEAAERHAAVLAGSRSFPIPEVLLARQHTGSSRHVTSRIIPLSRDSPAEQRAQQQIDAIVSEQDACDTDAYQNIPTEEQSLLQWCRSVGVELLAASVRTVKQ